MPTDLKAQTRARMRVTGENYTTARRRLLAERPAAEQPEGPVRVTVHTTRNGLPLSEENCGATTKTGRQCRNPFIWGQLWSGGTREQVLRDSASVRMLAQRRCPVHVDHSQPGEVLLVMDDVLPSPHTSPASDWAWQDQRSLHAIRAATSGTARAQALALYLSISELPQASTLTQLAQLAGLTSAEAEAAFGVMESLGLVNGGTLVA